MGRRIFWVTIGLLMVGAFTFEHYYTSLATQQIFSLEQASKSSGMRREVEETEYRALQKLSNAELSVKLEKIKSQWSRPQSEYGLSLSSLEMIEKRGKKEIPKRFEDNPVFQLLEKLGEGAVAPIAYEDSIICDKSRLYYENRMAEFPVLKNLTQTRLPASKNFDEQCVTYSMRQFQAPKMNFASCARGSGQPQVPGAKPCVSPNLVSLTYNVYMDVSECLNVDPKYLMPKIDFESGFFLNAYGVSKEAGFGQLTEAGILEVNKYYRDYMSEILKAASTKDSCARVAKHQELLVPASASPQQRCSMIAMPENPMRNVLYTVLLNRINSDRISGTRFVAGQDFLPSEQGLVALQNNESDELTGLLKLYKIKDKLNQLGFKNVNMHFFKEVTSLAGYNMGSETAVQLLSEYLQSRIENNLPLTWNDFNFRTTEKIKDIDGKEKSVTEVAANYVLSSILKTTDTPAIKELKILRRREFPRLWAEAYRDTFPVYLAYRANGYKGQEVSAFPIYGYPGYLSIVSDRYAGIRTAFKSLNLSPDMCTQSNFLKTPDNSLNNAKND